jgi:phage terminase large subunit-like protein
MVRSSSSSAALPSDPILAAQPADPRAWRKQAPLKRGELMHFSCGAGRRLPRHYARQRETDFGTIESDILDLCERFKVLSVAYDPWAATQLAQRLSVERVPVIKFRANAQNFSEPTKELDAAMRAHRIAHDGNPVLEWCIGNVVGRYDARANVYPRKARPEQKIDAAVVLIMAIARCMAAQPARSVYESRGG